MDAPFSSMEDELMIGQDVKIKNKTEITSSFSERSYKNTGK